MKPSATFALECLDSCCFRSNRFFVILLSNSSSVLRCSCKVCRGLVRGEDSDRSTARHVPLQTFENPLHRRLEVTGHASCVVFGEVVVLSESRTRTSDDDCPNLPHLQEISEHGAMGQPYSALLLRPVHPTAATERTDGVIRLDKARVRP